MLDRSWVDADKFEMELVDKSVETDPFMSTICAVNTDLGGEDEVALCPGSDEDPLQFAVPWL